jgi:hypothetical protein
MLRKRWHWYLFAALAAACTAFATIYFPRALPIVAIDLKMEREAALQAAAASADRLGLGPADYRQAATFAQDDPEVQTYIELEAGGRDAFIGLREGRIFEPYIWQVPAFSRGCDHGVAAALHAGGRAVRLPAEAAGG